MLHMALSQQESQCSVQVRVRVEHESPAAELVTAVAAQQTRRYVLFRLKSLLADTWLGSCITIDDPARFFHRHDKHLIVDNGSSDVFC